MLIPCETCGARVTAGDTWTHRRSTGFGPHNERLTSHCSRTCRAAYAGECVVCAAETRQATIAAFLECGRLDRSHPDAIAFGK